MLANEQNKGSIYRLILHKIKRLDRIADVLEGIETRLDALEELQDTAEQLRDCMGCIPPTRFSPDGTPGAGFLRIGGSVGRE